MKTILSFCLLTGEYRPMARFLFLLGLIVLVIAPNGFADDTVDNFTTDPGSGTLPVTSVTTGLIYTFTALGDSGTFTWINTGGGDGGSNCISVYSNYVDEDSPTRPDKVTITRNSGGFFKIKSLWINNVGMGTDVVIEGKKGGGPPGL